MRVFSRNLSRLSRRAQLESSGGVTQFAEVLRLVKQTPDVVDLGQGFPDFEGNQVARDVAHFAVGSDVRLNQYTPPSGLPALHEAIASFNGRRWREELEPGVNTLVTAGGTEAIFSALIALCNPGDTVAFCQPFWPWYLPSIRLTGAVPAPLRDAAYLLVAKNRYRLLGRDADGATPSCQLRAPDEMERFL